MFPSTPTAGRMFLAGPPPDPLVVSSRFDWVKFMGSDSIGLGENIILLPMISTVDDYLIRLVDECPFGNRVRVWNY